MLFYVSGEVKTSLVSGSEIDVTWHLSYPHRVSHLMYALLIAI